MYFTNMQSLDNDERLTYLITRLKKWKIDYGSLYSHFEWKAVLFNVSKSQENHNIIYASTFFGVKSDSIKENDITWKYDWNDKNIFKECYDFEPREIHLIKRCLDFNNIIDFFSNIKKTLFSGGNSKRDTTIEILDYKIRMDSIQNIDSHFNSTIYSPINWPFYEIKVETDFYKNEFRSNLFSKNAPYFDSDTFPQSFFSIPGIHASRDIMSLALPLYIAKIDSITTSRNVLSVKLKNLEKKDLSIKLSYIFNRTLGNHKEIVVQKELENTEIILEKENYNRLRLVLSVKDSPYYLQTLDVGYLPVKLTKFEKPTTLVELREFTKIGEDQFREFKETIDDKDSNNKILKEMLAFANTNEGIICVGVANDGITYTGVDIEPQKFRDTLTQTISDNCIPPTLKYNIDTFEFLDRFIYLIIVKEGEDKPYFHRIRKYVYFRANGTSRPILREELIKIFENSKSTTGY